MNFKINSGPLFTIIFKLINDNFKTRDFSLLIERVLAGVYTVKKFRRIPHFFQVSKGNTSVVDPSSGRAIYQIEQDSMTSL